MQTRLGLRTIKSREDPQIKKQDVSIAKARTDGKEEAITTPSNEEDQESSTILKCSSLLEQRQEKKTTLKRRSTRLSSKRSTPSDNKQRTILEAFTSQQVSTEEMAPKRTIPEKRQASCEYPSPEKEESKKIRLHPKSDNECVDENPPLTENVYATPVEEKRIRELSDSEDGEELSVRSKRLRKSAACFEDSLVDEEPDQQRSQSNEHDVVLPGKSSNGHETTKDDDYNAVEQKPWKAVIYESDQARIADECYTLKSLRKALDILLTFYAGNKRMALFHKITPVLRNSTKKNITLAHMCKILYLTPELYKLEPQVIAEYATNVETYSVELGGKWKPPLDGKSLEERETLLASKLEEYFKEHKEPNATVPEKELPKSTKVVDKKAWLQTAKIPERVREILLLQEQRKEETKKEAEQAKPEPKGSVKERRQALLERIRAKSQKK